MTTLILSGVIVFIIIWHFTMVYAWYRIAKRLEHKIFELEQGASDDG